MPANFIDLVVFALAFLLFTFYTKRQTRAALLRLQVSKIERETQLHSYKKQRVNITTRFLMFVIGFATLTLLHAITSDNPSYLTYSNLLLILGIPLALIYFAVSLLNGASFMRLVRHVPDQYALVQQGTRDARLFLLMKYVPPFVFVLTLSGIYRFDLLGWRWLIPVMVLLIATLHNLYGDVVDTWLLRPVPIAQTEWAALEPRVRHWEQLAGVRLAGIGVFHDGTNVASPLIAGIIHPTLLLSTSFLRNAEWRQNDALVNFLLGQIRLHSLIPIATCRAIGSALLACVLVYAYTIPDTPNISLFLLVLPILALIAWFFIMYLAQHIHWRAVFACDSFSTDLTGDPLAMGCAIRTLAVLRDVPLYHQGTYFPAVQKRLDILMARWQAGNGLAPWAREAVPAIGPPLMNNGDGALTVPLAPDLPPPLPPAPWSQMTVADATRFSNRVNHVQPSPEQ